MWVFRLSRALVFAVFGEGVTRSCHPERGRAPIRFLQDGKPESKDLGFVLPPPGAPLFAVLWRSIFVWRGRPRPRAQKPQPLPLAPPAGCPTFRRPLEKVDLLLRCYVAVALLCS